MPCPALPRALFAALLLTLGACQADQPPAPGDTVAPPATQDAVGSRTFFIHDHSRPFDAVGGVDSGVRSLITEIWYPARVTADSFHPRYGDYVFGDAGVHRRMMTATTFFHLTPDSVREGVSQQQMDDAIGELFQRQRPSWRDAPPREDGQSWPVVVVSHGDAGSRYNMATASIGLARSGYFVIAADHTGNSPYAMTGRDPALSGNSADPALQQAMSAVLPLLDEHGVYGSIDSYGQSYTPLGRGFSPEGFAQLDASLLQRVNDLRAVLAQLEAMNASGPFAGRLDLSRIGLMGRSFGGATTLAGLMLEDRFQAGFAVVPPAMPDLRGALPPQLLVKAPAESAILAAEGPSALASLHKPTFILSGAEDALILGLGTTLAESAGAPAPSAEHPYPLLEQTVDNATVPAALAVVQDTNHGSFGVSGPYWWPQLKPDTFPRFFAPGENYTLLDSEEAHRIQREMAIAFFDYTLRGDSDALDRLRSNPWQEAGTALQLNAALQAAQ
ncbi:acetylhydrolase [Seongchinamella sediminis]|uniref:Acetylhydrolase n=1 Tax=Seongchinamella sediminis TaxID=2283635 RepID=A0A3L7DXE4_9GAMM|nr:acetylhydrolase [Seongchinamella sediminis]RLQ20651.1 acetylhydrolase [Seongchinamella sediminis]